MNSLIKIRLANGRQEIFDCQPHQLSSIEHVKKHGKLFAWRECDRWYKNEGNGILQAPESEFVQAASGMKIDFDEAPGVTWGFELKVELPRVPGQPPQYEWKAVHPSRTSVPYTYDNERHAQEMAQMCYPEHQDCVRIVRNDLIVVARPRP